MHERNLWRPLTTGIQQPGMYRMEMRELRYECGRENIEISFITSSSCISSEAISTGTSYGFLSDGR